MIGKTLAHYRILEHAGAGGMGDVYVAEDTRLQRRVALKVLPEDLAGHPERLARFDREAKTVAGLNHPNIVTLHSVEEAEGLRFLTMELVEGQTLAALRRGRELTLEEIFDLFVPLADALHAAHQQGVIHRDLKPANVMVTAEGRVKILDFGLAKLHEAAQADGTRTRVLGSDLTEPGKVFGTVPYMSPEQVQGKPVDHRSDIFSAGILLYEMITGERPFTGETAADQISSVLRDQPSSISQLKRGLPRHLARIVQRCLEKDPNRRYQTALDLRNELEMLRGELRSGELQAVAGEMDFTPAAPRRRWPALAAAFVAGVALTALVWSQLFSGAGSPPPRASQPTRFQMLTYQAGRERDVHFSPDGSMVVYTSDVRGRSTVMLQRVGGERAIPLTESADASDPAFSPDGQLIAYRSEQGSGGLFVMGATGESARRLTDFGFCPAWSPDGKQIAFSQEDANIPSGRNVMSSLWVVDVTSGQTRQVTEHDAVHPRWSPHGDRIAFWGMEGEAGARNIWTIRPDGSDLAAVTSDPVFDYYPVWSPDGRHLYFASERGGPCNLWRVPIDERSGKLLGDLEPVTTPTGDLEEFDLSRDGRHLVFADGQSATRILRAEFDPATETLGPARPVVAGALLVTGGLGVSPDGEWIAFGGFTTQEDLYLARADGSALRRLTNDGHRDRGPDFTRDGKRVLFYSDRSGRYEIWEVQPDGSGLRAITETEGRSLWFPRCSPDGSQIMGINELGVTLFPASPDLVRIGPAAQLPNPAEHLVFQASSWSPDGRRLAGGVADRSGVDRPGLYVLSLDSGDYEVLLPEQAALVSIWIDERRMVVTTSGRQLQLIDITTGRTKTLLEDVTPGVLAASADRSVFYLIERVQESDLWIASFVP